MSSINKKEPPCISYSYLVTAMLLFMVACNRTEAVIPTPTTYPPTQTLLSTGTPLPTKTPPPTKTPLPTETPLPTVTPEGEIGSTWMRPMDGMVMVYIPKGVFTMGSNLGDLDEQPVHEVYLDAFWIDQTEITRSMYAQFDSSISAGNEPVQNISWEQAIAYCAWVGSRLPTEAEWEKAARSSAEYLYPWGNQSPTGELVNFADRKSTLNWEDVNVDDGYKEVAPVGNYPAGASIYGAWDLAGNVSEWVNDWYDETYYSTAPTDNPQGPVGGDFRVLRGGSYYSTASGIRTTDRSWYIAEGSTEYIGFRCAQSTIAP